MVVFWACMDYFQSSVASCRTPEDANYLPEHVGVNLEYSNKSPSSLTHLLDILRRWDKWCFGQPDNQFCWSYIATLITKTFTFKTELTNLQLHSRLKSF
jgi:hypothetical protein